MRTLGDQMFRSTVPEYRNLDLAGREAFQPNMCCQLPASYTCGIFKALHDSTGAGLRY